MHKMQHLEHIAFGLIKQRKMKQNMGRLEFHGRYWFSCKIKQLFNHALIDRKVKLVDLFKTMELLNNSYAFLLVRERSALADPYCQSTWNSVCLRVRNFEVKYLKNQRS